jgi:type IV pilus assembly protein PilB
LGDLLVAMGAINQKDLEQALADAGTDKRIGDYLVQRGLVTHAEVTQALAKQFNLPFLTLQQITFQPDAVSCIPEPMARRYQVVPVSTDGRVLTVASADPLNVLITDDLAFLTGLQIEIVLMTSADIERAIERVYIRGEFMPATGSLRAEAASAAPVPLPAQNEDSPIVRLVDSLLQQAIADHVSDIHIEPQREALRIRYRIDGVLQPVTTLEKDVQSGLVTRLKVLAGMDISERRMPLDGALRYNHSGGQVDLRVSTLPTIHGEKMVIRVFDPDHRLASLADLGLAEQQQGLFRQMLKHPYGLVLVCGPTGSGKTTTLQVMLNSLNDQSKNIITIEDPVEYQTPGINHVQVNQKIGLGFAEVLRSVLRQDPDIVMVGETRDQETADIAVRSALTGHLVLTSLHTNDAPGAIIRLLDMRVAPFLVASSVVGVVAQRLVRRLCPHCAQQVTYQPGSPQAIALGWDEPITAYEAVGCSRCHQTGYWGRVGLFEIMLINDEMRELVTSRANARQLRELAQRSGMLPMYADGVQKVRAGVTSVAEVLRATFQE